MTLVSISDAAKLVRKNRSTLYRDIERGHLKQTVLQDGDIRIDTAELLRAYGRLHNPDTEQKSKRDSGDKAKIALLEERNRSLERVIALEGELRRVKDQVTNELRARLGDKDKVIKVLESKLILVEGDKQLHAIPTLDLESQAVHVPNRKIKQSAGRIGIWWRRLLGKNNRSQKPA
jgi:hypothetical protein